mgnify:CR=1 FL=1
MPVLEVAEVVLAVRLVYASHAVKHSGGKLGSDFYSSPFCLIYLGGLLLRGLSLLLSLRHGLLIGLAHLPQPLMYDEGSPPLLGGELDASIEGLAILFQHALICHLFHPAPGHIAPKIPDVGITSIAQFYAHEKAARG